VAGDGPPDDGPTNNSGFDKDAHVDDEAVGYDDVTPYADDVSDDITTNNDGPPDDKPTDNDGYNNAGYYNDIALGNNALGNSE